MSYQNQQGPWTPQSNPAPRGAWAKGPQPIQQARSGAQYTRSQKGHSLVGLLCFDWITLYIRTIYYAISPNHYFHT